MRFVIGAVVVGRIMVTHLRAYILANDEFAGGLVRLVCYSAWRVHPPEVLLLRLLPVVRNRKGYGVSSHESEFTMQ